MLFGQYSSCICVILVQRELELPEVALVVLLVYLHCWPGEMSDQGCELQVTAPKGVEVCLTLGN
jgi:hypothetical protein